MNISILATLIPAPKQGGRNLAGIDDAEGLLFFESVAVIKRARELEAQPIAIRNFFALLDIHRHLFQDVYRWAGQKRTVEISKQGKPFFLTAYFDTGFTYIDTLIDEYKKNWRRRQIQIGRTAHHFA